MPSLLTKRLAAFAICALAIAIPSVASAGDVYCLQRFCDGKPCDPAQRVRAEPLMKEMYPSGKRWTEETCRMGYIGGTIASGDFPKVVNLLRQSHPFMRGFVLNSLGGSVAEAQAIGRLFRKFYLEVHAPTRLEHPGGKTDFLPAVGAPTSSQIRWVGCASACTLIYFGAVNRTGSVGLHRPSFRGPEFAKLSPADASEAYRQALAGMVRYLEEMEAPRRVVDVMGSTSSAELQWLDFDDETAIEQPPSFAEWSNSACGAVTLKERMRALRAMSSSVSAQERDAVDEINRRSSEKSLCEDRLVARFRDKLAAP